MSGPTESSARRGPREGAPAEPASAVAAPPARRRLLDGDRRVWMTSALVGVAMLALILAYLVKPRDYFTGTESVTPRSTVVKVGAGQRLCLPGVALPAGTGRVRLAVDTLGGTQPGLALDIATPEATVRGTLSPGGAQGRGYVEIPIAPRPARPASVPSTICLTATSPGTLGLRGMVGPQDARPLPTLDGRPFRSRVALWFKPPAGEQRSLLAMAPDALRRAALFRPGWVGPWTYVVLLLVGLPALALLAVRLLAGAESERRRRLPLAAAIAGLAFLNAAGWALVTPAFQAPDESEHFAYAQHVAETGRGIAGPASPYSSEQRVALAAVRHFSSIESPDARMPWLAADEARWRRGATRDGRGAPAREDGGGAAVATGVHSPLYYALLAPAYLAARGSSTFGQLWAMRLVSALLGALIAACAYAIVCELAPGRRRLAVAAGLLVAFQPGFAFMAGSVNNDMGVNAAAAVLLLLLVRGLRRGLSPGLGVGIGVTLAVLPLMKGTGYSLYPAAVLALLGILWRHHRRLAALVPWAGLAAAFVITELAWSAIARTFRRSLFTTPGGAAPGEGLAALDDPVGYVSYLWQVFLPKLPSMDDHWIQTWPFFNVYVERGWAAFGWYAVTFPRWVPGIIVLTMGAVGLLGLVTLLRRRDLVRRRGWELAVLALAVAGVIGAVHAFYYTPSPRGAIPEVGRYAFPVITALAAAAVCALVGLPARWRAVAATALVVLVLGLNAASQLLTLAGFYT